MASSPSATVLFDGVCGLCNRSIDFLLRHDRLGALRFAALQSPAAQALLRQHGLHAAELSSVVVIADGCVYHRSDAVVHALRKLGGPWRVLAAALQVLPRRWRDRGYEIIASNRYRWFGQRTSCRIPTAQERTRFLVD